MNNTATNDQVISAINTRKKLLISNFNPSSQPDQNIAFKHIITVLNHAKIIFETDSNKLINTLESIKNNA